MFLGFNTADYPAAKAALGLPSCQRIFPTDATHGATFGANVDIASRVDFLAKAISELNAKGISAFVSEKPTPADVVSGALDEYFIALAFMLKGIGNKYGIQNYYTVWHEPENDIKTAAHPGNPIDSALQFAQMLDHVHHVIHQVTTTDYVEIGPVYMAYQWEDATKSEYKVTIPSDWFPVKADFIGADVYSDLYHKAKTRLSQHTGFQKILANSGDHYIFIVERGIKDHALQADTLIDDFGYLAGLDVYVVGMLYWYNTGTAGDWRLASDAADVWKNYNYIVDPS